VASANPVQRIQTRDPVREETSREERLDDLNQFLTRLDTANSHYEVLEVTATSPPSTIKSSYYLMAKKYHPDRFHLQAGTLLHARIESAFAKITQAYETLSDSRRRVGYDAKLAAQEKVREFAESAPKATDQIARSTDPRSATAGEDDLEQAENAFKEGFAALRQGQAKLALTNLAAAARAAPMDARYRAYYGRALAADERMRRAAEAELQSAIKLDPGNASYRVMLAEVYCDIGLFRRAERELERATSLDPHNLDAQKLMRKVEAARAAKIGADPS
jgi:curved DNA-binding protein CbpA